MRQPHAIVIEDDPILSRIYVKALEQAGFTTVLDINGNKYTTLLSAAEPDLVILDLHLPYASGAEILSDIRANHPNIAIAVVTADLIKAKSLPAKADHILIKPVTLERLQKVAESVKEKL